MEPVEEFRSVLEVTPKKALYVRLVWRFDSLLGAMVPGTS
jgi:hypothetical protein